MQVKTLWTIATADECQEYAMRAAIGDGDGSEDDCAAFDDYLYAFALRLYRRLLTPAYRSQFETYVCETDF